MTGLRTELKLQQVNRRLIRRNVPLVERHGIVRDLRANLRDAEQPIGEQSALDQLGDLDDLAADYASSCHRNRPRIRAGLIAAAWTLIILATVSLVRCPDVRDDRHLRSAHGSNHLARAVVATRRDVRRHDERHAVRSDREQLRLRSRRRRRVHLGRPPLAFRSSPRPSSDLDHTSVMGPPP